MSEERKKYLKQIKIEKILVLGSQILILVLFLAIWEIGANKGLIDSFITSSPSRILKTFANFSSNNLIEHIKVTVYETLIGFSLGTVMGFIIAIILWWSKLISKIAEPYLVILNSLPKVALGPIIIIWVGARYWCNYCNGNCNCDGGLMTTSTGKPANALNTAQKWLSLDGQALANLFSKMKENENIDDRLELKVDRVPMYIPKPEFKDFAEQI